MVDLSKVSQRVLNQFEEITQEDGKKGISNASERNKIAELLSNSSGNYDINFLNEKMLEFDVKEAAKNASQDVVKDIDKAMKLDGNKNAIDSDKETAILDSIIDNTLGNYSADDIKYAKLVKKQFGLSDRTPLSEANQENKRLSGHLEEARQKLRRQNEYIANLEKALAEKETEINEAIQKGKINAEEVENLKKELAKKSKENKELIAKLNTGSSENLELMYNKEATNMPQEILPTGNSDFASVAVAIKLSEALSKLLNVGALAGKVSTEE